MNQSVKFSLIDTILRIVVLFVLIAWCIGIILPFLEPVLWGAIIAVALHPFFARVRRWLGNRNMLAGVLLTALILVILLLPTAWLIKSLVEGIQNLVVQFRNQTLMIPPPDPSVAGWPLIGKPISEIWLLAHESLESAITTYREPLSKLGISRATRRFREEPDHVFRLGGHRRRIPGQSRCFGRFYAKTDPSPGRRTQR